jgi:uncharacterized protein (TIGR02646 family)
MIRFAKGPAPARLTALATTPTMTWAGLGAADRQPIREALIRDQGALCAYCQRRIRAEADQTTGVNRMRIEHWDARSDSPNDQLRWGNMLGVCVGTAALERHCDTSRGNRVLFLHPVEASGPDPREHLRYTKAGVVEPVADNPHVAEDIRVLNLNAFALKRARREVYDALIERLRRRDFSVPELRKIERECAIRPGIDVREHAEVVRHYVVNKLRQRGERT